MQSDAPLFAKEHALRLRLLKIAEDADRVLVAYSGGVDSAYLAWMAHKILGTRALAVIADSPSLPRKELAAAISFAHQHRMAIEVVTTHEIESDEYSRNDALRCFHCKDELFRTMTRFADRFGSAKMIYGRNVDDSGDFRPGQRAAEIHAVYAPLVEAGLRKEDIRALAQRADLSVWSKPASACLASRVEYRRAVSPELLAQIEAAEDFLHEIGFTQVRVRHHGDVARVEIARHQMESALSLAMLDRMTAGIKNAGFKYVALDTSGYRSGSMNEVIPVEVLFEHKA